MCPLPGKVKSGSHPAQHNLSPGSSIRESATLCALWITWNKMPECSPQRPDHGHVFTMSGYLCGRSPQALQRSSQKKSSTKFAAQLVTPLRAGRSALVLRWLPYPVPSEVHAYSTPLTVSNHLCGIYGASSG